MKIFAFIPVFLIAFFSFSNGQDIPGESRKSQRLERQKQQRDEIKKLLEEKSFSFNPTHAMPLGGGNVHLNYAYEVEVKGDTINSYLPFYGVAYRVDYGGHDAGFNFVSPIEEYELEENGKGYLLKMEVTNDADYLSYTFNISDLGYTTLSIISTNRQAISFYGRIEAIK